MNYNYSDIQRHNLRWFRQDNNNATLMSIHLADGKLRGLYPFKVDLKYPITAFSGKNGSGKTTLLAIVACAYHNYPNGFKPHWRHGTYYTFSDFFIQAKDEIPPDGIVIGYQFLHNRWKKSKILPNGIGLGWQLRKKPRGGRWNNYSRRMRRDVVYFGINRIVPHSEKSVLRNYSRYFENRENYGWENQVKTIVGRILNSDYDDFWYSKYSNYLLPFVIRDDLTYSGFNMGAGESALFNIFSTIFRCGTSLLLVIDEIELGLHEEAQSRLIDELNKICNEKHIQIIFTTHSYSILKRLPPEALFFVEKIRDNTLVIPSISPEFAAGKLAGENSNELDIFVEDKIGESLVKMVLKNEIRRRVNVIPIGSSSAVIRQLSARYKNLKAGEAIAILDGDQVAEENNLKKLFIKLLENVEDIDDSESWINDRISYLPGEVWPEKWIVSKLRQHPSCDLSDCLAMNDVELDNCLLKAINSGKHNEFYTIAKDTSLDEDFIRTICCKTIVKEHKEYFDDMEKNVKDFLKYE